MSYGLSSSLYTALPHPASCWRWPCRYADGRSVGLINLSCGVDSVELSNIINMWDVTSPPHRKDTICIGEIPRTRLIMSYGLSSSLYTALPHPASCWRWPCRYADGRSVGLINLSCGVDSVELSNIINMWDVTWPIPYALDWLCHMDFAVSNDSSGLSSLKWFVRAV